MGLLTSQHIEFSGNNISQIAVAYAALNASTTRIRVIVATRQYDGSTTPDLVGVTFDSGGNDEGLTHWTNARSYETTGGDRHMGAEAWYLDDPTDLSAGDMLIEFQGSTPSVEGVLNIWEFDDECESGASGVDGVDAGTKDPSITLSTRDGLSEILMASYHQIYDASPFTPGGVLSEDYDGGQVVTGCGFAGHGSGTGGSDTASAAGNQQRRMGAVAIEILISSANAIPTIVQDTADAADFSTSQPQLEFTGSDADGDDVRYNIQISDDENFGSGVTLVDSHTTGI